MTIRAVSLDGVERGWADTVLDRIYPMGDYPQMAWIAARTIATFVVDPHSVRYRGACREFECDAMCAKFLSVPPNLAVTVVVERTLPFPAVFWSKMLAVIGSGMMRRI